jgi:hypothetical protein
MYKRLIFLTSIILVLSLVSSASAVLLGQWTFDDGTLTDNSGNGHDGTIIQGHPSTSVTIVYDADRDSNVLDINTPPLPDGVAGSWVDCGGGESGGWADMSSQVTISLWVKIREHHTTNLYIASKDASFQIDMLETGQILIFNGVTMGISPSEIQGATGLLDDQWHHVAYTFDTAGPRRIYVDGLISSPLGLIPL